LEARSIRCGGHGGLVDMLKKVVTLLALAVLLIVGLVLVAKLRDPRGREMDRTSEYLDYLWKHPPRCICGFNLEPAHLEDERFNGHGDGLYTAFALRCLCGNTQLHVLGHYWRDAPSDPLIFGEPIVVQCKSCGKTVTLFDRSKDGYDAEIGYGLSGANGENPAEEFKCDTCGPCAIELFVGLEYHDDLFGGEFGDFRGREQDLFSWFTLFGRCSKCLRFIIIGEFECA